MTEVKDISTVGIVRTCKTPLPSFPVLSQVWNQDPCVCTDRNKSIWVNFNFINSHNESS